RWLERAPDKGEVGGSSPPRPTILGRIRTSSGESLPLFDFLQTEPGLRGRRLWCRCCQWRRSDELGVVHVNILLNLLNLNSKSVARSRLRPAERHLHAVRVAIIRVINLRRVSPKRGFRVPNQPQQQP